MAALKKIDVNAHLCGLENVRDKPPIPGRPGSGKFHNRGTGKLFPSTCQNKLFNEKIQDNKPVEKPEDKLALVLHPDAKLNVSEPNTPRTIPSYCRRTQSAKAKTVRKDGAQKSHRQRPVSAGCRLTRVENGSSSKPAVIDLANKVIPDLFEIEKQKILALPSSMDCNQNVFNRLPPMHFSRPSSACHAEFENDSLCEDKKKGKSKQAKNNLKPSVYGLQRQRQFYGSAPDLTSTNCYFDQYPYKISDVTETQYSEYDYDERDVPSTLEPLLPWLQNDLPEEVIGVNPDDCLVFLAPTDWTELPELPEPQPVDEDLPYIQDLTTPRPWNPKKYPYYTNKQPVEDWVCKHGSQLTGKEPGAMESNTLYRQSFSIPRMRTADVVKKEITDLENLLKGIGNMDSDCGMVNFQSEIFNFQNLLNDTLAMAPERLKNPPHESPKDTFGLIKMVADHDVVIMNIEERVKDCRDELAELELEAGIDTARQHFRKRSNSVL